MIHVQVEPRMEHVIQSKTEKYISITLILESFTPLQATMYGQRRNKRRNLRKRLWSLLHL